jgi:hypothetical protein
MCLGAWDIMISSTGFRSYSRPTGRQKTEHSDTHSLELSSFRDISQLDDKHKLGPGGRAELHLIAHLRKVNLLSCAAN